MSGGKADPVKREIMILEALKGGPNIIQLIAVVKDSETDQKSIITEYVEHEALEDIQD